MGSDASNTHAAAVGSVAAEDMVVWLQVGRDVWLCLGAADMMFPALDFGH